MVNDNIEMVFDDKTELDKKQKKERKERDEMMKFEHMRLFKCFIKEVGDDGFKTIPMMNVYDLDGTIKETPATFGYIDMKADSKYWENVLDWNIVISNEYLTKYIKHRLGYYDKEYEEEFGERLKIYKKIHRPEFYKRILNRRVLLSKNHLKLLDSKPDSDLDEGNV